MEIVCKGSYRQGNIDKMRKRNTFHQREKSYWYLITSWHLWRAEMGRFTCSVVHSDPSDPNHNKSVDCHFPDPATSPKHIKADEWPALLERVSSVLENHEEGQKVNKVRIFQQLFFFFFTMKHWCAGEGGRWGEEDPWWGCRGPDLQRPRHFEPGDGRPLCIQPPCPDQG